MPYLSANLHCITEELNNATHDPVSDFFTNGGTAPLSLRSITRTFSVDEKNYGPGIPARKQEQHDLA